MTFTSRALEKETGWQANLGQSSINLSFPRDENWWTGKIPQSCHGYKDGKLYALAPPSLDSYKREDVQAYFDNGWALTELLFSGLLEEEAFYRPPYHDLRHPMVFYFLHPAVFYINKFKLAGLVETSFNPHFEVLFEIGVDEMSWDDMSKNELSWPSIDELVEYRRKIYNLVSKIISEMPEPVEGKSVVDQNSPYWTLFMGFEHERIHIETSSVLIREMPLHLVSKPAALPDCFTLESEVEPQDNQFIEISEGEVEIGKPLDFPSFGWDNEYGERKTRVAPFSASKQLISNREFYQFVRAGGYAEKRFWTEEGWAWRSFRDVQAPTFWLKAEDSEKFELRTIFEVVPMQWSWACVVNYHEAKAYASWMTEQDNSAFDYRLITEAEHHRLRQESGLLDHQNSNAEVLRRYNLALKYSSESPVDAESDYKFNDLFGNLWQWAEDHFHPLQGSEVHPYYDDFSTPCYDGEHQMILGGSFISIGDEASCFARYHFRPHFFQHAGFRLVRSDGGTNGAVVKL